MKKKKSLFIFTIVLASFSIGVHSIYAHNDNEKVANIEQEKVESAVKGLNQNIREVIESKNTLKEDTKKAEKNTKTPVETTQETKTNNVSVKQTQVPQKTTTNRLDIVRQNTEQLGTIGRLFIPSINLSVAVYGTDNSDASYTQSIVDNNDSAAYFQMNSKYIIADHNYQGFDKIINIPIGEKAYIKRANGQISVYRITNKFEGKNLGHDLVDLNDNSVFNGNGSLIMYTCYKIYEYNNHVMITTWELES